MLEQEHPSKLLQASVEHLRRFKIFGDKRAVGQRDLELGLQVDDQFDQREAVDEINLRLQKESGHLRETSASQVKSIEYKSYSTSVR